MERSTKSSFLLPLFVILVAWAGFGVKPVPGADNVVAESPTFKVGDEWRYSNREVLRVVGFEGDYVITESNYRSCQGCRYFRDKNWTIVRVLDSQGKPSEHLISGWKYLDFPLYVGKEWTQEIKGREITRGEPKWTFNRYKVTAYEEVSVQAGTFKAFRISHDAEHWSGGGGHEDRWYAPDVTAFVKRVALILGWGNDWNLVSYTLK